MWRWRQRCQGSLIDSRYMSFMYMSRKYWHILHKFFGALKLRGCPKYGSVQKSKFQKIPNPKNSALWSESEIKIQIKESVKVHQSQYQFEYTTKMPRGTNSNGSDYNSYGNNNYWYGNPDGSTYSSQNGHRHYTAPSGNDGWHINDNNGTSSSGRQYRNSDTRHARHNRR